MAEDVAMLKEELRMKEKELQELAAEKSKNEAKVKHVLKVSHEKIEELKTTVAEKEKEINKIQNIGAASTLEKKSGSEGDDDSIVEKLKKNLEQIQKEKSVLAKELKEAAKSGGSSSEKTVEVRDPKLVEAVKKLKSKNQDLKERIEKVKGKTRREEKEKELLTQEIKRLRKQPGSPKELKKKLKEQEEKQKQSIESLQKIVDEKTEIISSFEEVMLDIQDGEDVGQSPAEFIKNIKNTLDEIQKEKEQLDQDLKNLKDDFKKKVDEQIKKIEEEWEEKLKKAEAGKKQEECEECVEGAPAWMATFSDMVTLVLVFFILMYAIASKNVQTFKSAIIGAEAKSIGVLEALNAVEMQERMKQFKPETSNDILSGMTQAAEDSPMSVETSRDKIVVRVPGASLFKSGGADLQRRARPLLDGVIKVVNKYPEYKIHIQGHTDDEPISTARFPTNWELSAARATAVLRYFIDRGSEPEKMTATGYADTFPIARNDTEFGRIKNRRVEFVLEKEK